MELKPCNHISIMKTRSGDWECGGCGMDFVPATRAESGLLAALKHLVKLLEPLEANGTMNVPGLATLNQARAAIARHEHE